jgi:hypothetical protein
MIYELCANVDNAVVVNVVVCNNVAWLIARTGGEWRPVYENNLCGIGWTWDGEQFNPPEFEPPEEPE